MSNFKQIPDWQDYLIYDDGRIYSIKSKKMLKTSKNRRGYAGVTLRNKGKRLTTEVHKLVALCFLSHKYNKTHVVDHINNNKLDNRLDNLQIITHRENCVKDKKNGTSKYTGVYLTKSGKYAAVIRNNRKKIHLGSFMTEIEASIAYENYLKLNVAKMA
jgi:hypothetical protein